MEISGNRPRTIRDYKTYVEHFMRITKTRVLEEFGVEHIYTWFETMDVGNQTKLTRLKCLKALLWNRSQLCSRNKYLYWSSIGLSHKG